MYLSPIKNGDFPLPAMLVDWEGNTEHLRFLLHSLAARYPEMPSKACCMLIDLEVCRCEKMDKTENTSLEKEGEMGILICFF